MRMFALLSALFLVVGCQSLTAPLTADSLPAPLTASGGQPRFPIQNDADVAQVADVEVEAEAKADEPAAADTTKSECKRPTFVTANAVGNPCETTRSFMESKGMTEEQIARVLNGAAAH
jgi:hypothetical protein